MKRLNVYISELLFSQYGDQDNRRQSDALVSDIISTDMPDINFGDKFEMKGGESNRNSSDVRFSIDDQIRHSHEFMHQEVRPDMERKKIILRPDRENPILAKLNMPSMQDL